MGISGDFDFQHEGWQSVVKKLKEKWKTIEERKNFGAIISSVVFRDVMDHFDKERGPSGGWQAWSKSYREHMSKIGKGGNRILQDTGRLRQSFTPDNFRAQSDGILFYNNAKVNGFPYGLAHDQGGKKLPQRKFMWLSDKGMNSVVEVVNNWLVEGVAD